MASCTIGLAMAKPFSLFVNITIAVLSLSFAATKHLNAPLSPQCHSETPFSVRSMPQPSPQNRFLESSRGTRSVRLVHDGSRATCGVCILWLALVRRLCVGIVAGRSASVEIRAPGVTAARHSQRYKDCLGHEVIQWLAGNLLDSALQVHEAFSGIAEALPWREADCERVAVAPPVGKAGAMTQHEASGNFRESVIAFDVGFRKVRRKRSIERQFALINELEHPVRKDRLAQ